MFIFFEGINKTTVGVYIIFFQQCQGKSTGSAQKSLEK